MGFEGAELLWLLNCINLVALMALKKMQNLIRISLIAFLCEISQNCHAVRVLHQDPGLWYPLGVPVCSARCPIEAFF